MGAFYTTTTASNYRELVSGKTVTHTAVVATGQGILRRGQILGRSAGGKYTLTDLPPLAILTVDVDTTAGDVQAPLHFQGWFKNNACTPMTGQTIGAQAELLRDVGIFLETVMETTGLIVRSVEPFEAEALEKKPEPEGFRPSPRDFEGVESGSLLVGEEVSIRRAEGYKVLTEPLEGDFEKAVARAEEAAEEDDEDAKKKKPAPPKQPEPAKRPEPPKPSETRRGGD